MIHDTNANDSTSMKIIYRCKTSFKKKPTLSNRLLRTPGGAEASALNPLLRQSVSYTFYQLRVDQ